MYTGIFQGKRRINYIKGDAFKKKIYIYIYIYKRRRFQKKKKKNYIKGDEDNIRLMKKQRNHEVLAIRLSINRPHLYSLLLFEH